MPELTKAFKDVVSEMSEGFAYHELIYDNGTAVNYKVLEVNNAFETITGISKDKIINKLATETYGVDTPPYLDIYKDVVENDAYKIFTVYFPPMKKLFKIKAFHNTGNRFSTIFEDVTDEINRFEEVKEKEEFTRVVLNSIGDGIIACDLEGKITGLNPVAEKFLNNREESLIDVEVFELVKLLEDSNVNEFIQAFEEVKAKKIIYKSKKDYKFKTSDKYASFTVSPLVNDEGHLIGVIITISDVTDKHQMNQKIRESEIKFRSIFDSSKDAMISLSLSDNRFIEANKAFYTMFGFDEDINIENLSPKDISTEYQENNQKSITQIAEKISECKKHGSFYFDWTHKRQDGSEFYSNVLLTFVKAGNESFIHVNIRDINDKIKTRKALVETKNELRLKNEISNLFIIEKGKEFYIKSLNHIMKDFEVEFGFFGYIDEDENLVAPSLTEGIWDKCKVKGKSLKFPKETWTGIWGDSLKQKKTLFKNKDLKFPAGHIKLSNAISAPIVIQNQVIGLFILGNHKTDFNSLHYNRINAICTYIAPLLSSRLNEMRDKKALIQAKNKAEESDRLKSAFLANMSHEIRTPMNGILGFVSLIKEMDLSKDEIMNFIDNIDKSGKRMLNILTDIMEASKIEAKTIEIRKIDFEVDDLINEVYNFFKLEADSKNINFEIEKTESQQEIILNTDKTKVNQILTNIVGNALKFTSQGYVKFGYEVQDNELLFFVKDSGIGIKKENLERIFERFIQEDISLSREFEGAGLGLSISKAFIEMLNGKIWCESEYKKGTTFYFTIPY